KRAARAVDPPLPGERAGLAVYAARRHDETGSRGGQRRVAEPELVHRAGREVLDDRVRPADERIDHLARLRPLQIERQTALRSIQMREPRLVVEIVAPRRGDLHVESRKTRPAAALDFDHV